MTHLYNISHSIAFFFILLAGIPSLSAQNAIQYWNTENGLSNDWVSAVVQDHEGYIWIATQYGLNRFDGYEFKHYQYEPNNPNSIGSNWIRSMVQDSSGTLWLGAYLSGVNAFDPYTGLAQHYELISNNPELEIRGIISVFCDQNQTVWSGGSNGLFAKKTSDEKFQPVGDIYINDIQQNQSKELFILAQNKLSVYEEERDSLVSILDFDWREYRSFFIDKEEVIWLFGENKLLKLFKENTEWVKELIEINNQAYWQHFFESPLYEDSQNRIWVGGSNGITIIEADRKKISTTPYDNYFPKGKPIGKALSFFEDAHGNMWIGTSKGLLLQSPFAKRFDFSQDIPHLEKFSNIREIVQAKNTLWISEPKGLFCIQLDKPNLPPLKVLDIHPYAMLYASDGYLYAVKQGLYQIDIQNFTKKYTSHNSSKSDIWGGWVWSMGEDKAGNIWIASSGVLNRYNPKTGKTDHFTKEMFVGLKDLPDQELIIDKKGRLWLGSLYSGLYLLEKPHEVEPTQNLQIQQFTYKSDDENSLSNPMVLGLAEDKKGNIWIATDGGLNQLNTENFSIKRYLKKDGLRDEKVMGLVADDVGFLWGSTIGHGVFRLNPEDDSFTFFDRRDGLISNNFLLSAVGKNEEGILFFGSDNQLQCIAPNRIDQIKKPQTSLLFTEMQIAGKTKDNAAQKQSLIHKNAIELPPNYESFSIQFSTLNYFQARKTEYQYLLEGLHNNWQSNGLERNITFTGLAPGTYHLKIRAINSDLIFEKNEKSLQITIHPPWWQTGWAYLFYLLLLMSIIYAIYRFQLERQLEKNEAQRWKELDTMKTDFFTNITHEFRTPLTVILGMARQLQDYSKKEIRHKATLIQRNGQQLLDLINQILDLSKLEAGKLPTQWVHGDLLPYLSYINESFHSLAAAKNIKLHFLPETDSLWMDYDEEKIKQIITNLISNAVKYTPNGGDIYFQVRKKENVAELIVRDTGKGISEKHLPNIFERFYQAEEVNEGNAASVSATSSSGIGLALTKELVQTLGGTIQVNSKVDRGTVFEIQLPILKEEGVGVLAKGFQDVKGFQDDIPLERDKLSSSLRDVTLKSFVTPATSTKEQSLILLIEDHQDVLYYLSDCLKSEYRLATAKDGQEGIQKALNIIPDLIVSDVMMPIKDGFEVCQTLKTDDKTSHIPIILLTAKADTDSKIEGLELGADAYLPKPFDQKELQVRIKKLLEMRHQLQQRYQKSGFLETEHAAPSDNTTAENTKSTVHKEDAFISKVRMIVEENLMDTNFGILQLCHALGISRVHLHRKLKALTNLSTSHFIRRIRLQKAKMLLENSDLNVSEVAYEVGFSDPAYFSRLYSETFGESPSVTRK